MCDVGHQVDRIIPTNHQEIHVNSGLYYYGYRFYDPNLQRWPNRDPLGEPGFEVLRSGAPDALGDGPNLYFFVGNNSVGMTDPFGLKDGEYGAGFAEYQRCMKDCKEMSKACYAAALLEVVVVGALLKPGGPLGGACAAGLGFYMKSTCDDAYNACTTMCEKKTGWVPPEKRRKPHP